MRNRLRAATLERAPGIGTDVVSVTRAGLVRLRRVPRCADIKDMQSISARFSHMHVGVTDLDRALAFYHEQLGLPVRRLTPNMGSVSLGDTSVDLDLVEGSRSVDASATRRETVIALKLPDLVAFHAAVVERGVATLDAPTRRPWGAFNFYLLDPDGHTIEVEEG